MLLFPNKRIVLNAIITLCIVLLSGSIIVPTFIHTIPSQKNTEVDFKELLANDPDFQKEYQKMSPAEREQMNQLTQELETISKDPEKLAAFEKNLQRTMEDMSKAIEEIGGEDALATMSEEDLTDFIMKFTGEQEEKQKNQKKRTVVQKPKPTITQSASTLSGKELLLENIRAIIQHIDLFLIKAASMHELPEKVESWSKRGTLGEWGKTATWNKIRNHIELLQSKLTYIVMVNATTKKRTYLDYIYEDEALKSLIQLLKIKLAESEPLINVTNFELGDENSLKTNQSIKATQQVINSLGDALQKLTINESINKAIQKYEPLAKEMREAEEKFLKAAESEAKKKPTIARSVPIKHTPSAPTTSGYKPDSGYQKGYYPSSSDYYGPQPRSGTRRSSRSRAYDQNNGGTGTTGGAHSAATPSKSESSKEKEDKDKKVIPTEQDKKVNKLLNTFEGEMENIGDINQKMSVASKLASSKAAQPPTRLTLKIEESLKEITGSLKAAALAADDLYTSVSDPQAYAQIMQAATYSIAPFMNAIQQLYNADTFDATIEKARTHSFPVEDAWKAAESNLVSAQKELAILQDPTIMPPATLTDLQNAQQKVDNAQITRDNAERAWKAENALVIAAQTAKEEAIPADVANVLTEYKNVQKKVVRFSKKPRSRRIAPSKAA